MKHILLALCLSIACASPVFAECYGDAAEAFGCGVSRPTEDSLESFGESRGEVLPDSYANARQISASELFSHEETVNHYRQIYRSFRGSSWSEADFRNSMNRQSQPLRRFISRPMGAPRF